MAFILHPGTNTWIYQVCVTVHVHIPRTQNAVFPQILASTFHQCSQHAEIYNHVSCRLKKYKQITCSQNAQIHLKAT